VATANGTKKSLKRGLPHYQIGDTYDGLPFGEIIRLLRTGEYPGRTEEQYVSQAVVADRAGISPGYVGLLETQKRGSKPSLDNVRKIADAVGATVLETEHLMLASGHLLPGQRLINDELPTVESVVRAHPLLTDEAKQTILNVYWSLLGGRDRDR
jgi:transcriptional regulator with XRE-family HTH domain